MDIKLIRSIYNTNWLIQPQAGVRLLDLWEKSITGEIKWDERNVRSDSYHSKKFFEGNKVVFAPDNSHDAKDFKGFAGATTAVIPVCGPIMKHDFCGSYGTASLGRMVREASATESIETIILLIDSPGGSVDGTEAFANIIKASTKNTIAVCENLMASAGYWIGSSCKQMYASSNTDVIGCIGTMVSWMDGTKAASDKGYILREYYATDSKDKNRAFIEANAGNGKKLVSELLDPLNDVFLSHVREMRGSKLDESALTGKDYVAKNAMEAGLIDGVKTLEQVINENSKSQFRNMSQTTMTAAEFKTANPAAYNEILGIGAENERLRIAGWKAWEHVDAAKVEQGIESGKEITASDISVFSAKAANKAGMARAEAENPVPVTTPTTTDPKDEEAIALEANTALVLKEMGIK